MSVSTVRIPKIVELVVDLVFVIGGESPMKKEEAEET